MNTVKCFEAPIEIHWQGFRVACFMKCSLRCKLAIIFTLFYRADGLLQHVTRGATGRQADRTAAAAAVNDDYIADDRHADVRTATDDRHSQKTQVYQS